MLGVLGGSVIAPGAVIGIIGGGQLAKMMSAAAANLGYKTLIYSDTHDAPATHCCTDSIIAPYDDKNAAERFIHACDVITYEFENIPPGLCEEAESEKPLRPGSRALHLSRHRLKEKQFAESLEIPVPRYFAPERAGDIVTFLRACPHGCILKTAGGGYDGKGQTRLPAEADEAFCESALRAFSGAEIICEEMIPFTAETSVGAARTVAGEVAFFPSSENIHGGGILRKCLAPGKFPARTIARARDYAGRIADACDYIGVMAAEFFVLEDGSVIFNEFAPRPHNSLHWTIDACVTDQFEQHIRMICGLPCGDTSVLSRSEMINLIGSDIERLGEYLSDKRAKVHIYGKERVEEGRKMGHITFLL